MHLIASKRIAVTEPVWAELSDLRRPGETFSQLLADMVENYGEIVSCQDTK